MTIAGIVLFSGGIVGFGNQGFVIVNCLDLGDISSADNGKVNATDISILAAYVRSIDMMNEHGSTVADLNGDSKINVSDISLLAAHIKGIKPVS